MWFSNLSLSRHKCTQTAIVQTAGLPEPPVLAFAVPGSNAVDVYWHSSLWGSPTSYHIHRGLASNFVPDGSTLLHTESGSGRTYNDATAANGTTYYYKIIAENATGVSSPTPATAYPDIVTAITPSATLAGPALQGITQWWDLTETADSLGSNPRHGSLPTKFPREWVLDWVDQNEFGSFTGSAVSGGRTVAAFTGDSRLANACPSRNLDISYHPWTLVIRFNATSFGLLAIFDAGAPGNASGKPAINIDFSSGHARLTSYPLFGTVADVLVSTVALSASTWYTVAASYSETDDRLEITVVDPSGTVTRTLGSSGIGVRQLAQGQDSINRIGHGYSGYIGPFAFFREVLTDSQLQWFNNSGSGRYFSEARFQPMDDPGPAPFSFLRKHVTNWITVVESKSWDIRAGGFFWLAVHPLWQWNPTLSASLGRYVWIYSSDHAHNDGVLIGYSDDPAIKPTVWTKALPGTDITPPTGRGSEFDGPESPWLVYNPDDANGRPFYLYAHHEMLNNFPVGVSGDTIQETLLYSSPDLSPGSWVYESEAVPCTPIPGGVNISSYAHTGYAKVHNPNTLPGVTNWTCYHRANSKNDIFLCTNSDDPKNFNPLNQEAPLQHNPGCDDGGLSNFEFGDIIVVGGNVYNITNTRAANQRLMVCVQLAFDHGQWRRPITGKRWPIGEQNPFDFPTLGYTQESRIYYETGILHIYRLWGFADWNGDQRIDYYTAIFDESAANSARPVGAIAENNGNGIIKITVMDALPHRNYNVYRKTTGAYALLGTMSTTLDGDGRVPYIDSTVSNSVTYTYQVRTLFNAVETRGAEVTITARSFDDTIQGSFNFRTLCRLDTSKTVFNVKTAFGAAGDGLTDDTVAIRNAVAAASASGGIVYLPTGTYNVCPQYGDPLQLGPYNTTINTGTGVLTATGNAFLPGMSVYFVNTGTLPQISGVNVAAGVGNWYFVGSISGSTFKLYTTNAHALAQTSPIAFSSAGSGVQLVFPPYNEIFTVNHDNVIFQGDGPTLSILKGFVTGMLDPATHWITTGDTYVLISRGNMFYLNSTARSISNVQFRSLKIDGQCPFTGDNSVGGIPATGDGWDIGHKAIAISGPNYVNNTLVYNCDLCNWRGEIIWAGGDSTTLGTLFILSCRIRGSNADGVSVGTSTFCINTTIGGSNAGDDVYNGFENAINAFQYVVIEGCTIRCGSSTVHGNGIACIGERYSTWLIYRTDFVNCNTGIQFNTEANNVSVDRVTFTNCTNCTITTILSGGGTGFAAFGFSNITVNGGTLFYCQDDKVTDYTGYTHRPISFTFITLTNNARLFGGVFAGVVTDWGFWPLVDHVTIDATSRDTDAGNNGGVAPIWQNITREDPTASCGIKIDEFTATLTTNFVPMTDRTRFGNANALPAHQLAVIDPSLLVNYPTGFMTTCFSASATNWYLKADAAWNTWPSDINVTSGGITIRFNGTLFDRIG